MLKNSRELITGFTINESRLGAERSSHGSHKKTYTLHASNMHGIYRRYYRRLNWLGNHFYCLGLGIVLFIHVAYANVTVY